MDRGWRERKVAAKRSPGRSESEDGDSLGVAIGRRASIGQETSKSRDVWSLYSLDSTDSAVFTIGETSLSGSSLRPPRHISIQYQVYTLRTPSKYRLRVLVNATTRFHFYRQSGNDPCLVLQFPRQACLGRLISYLYLLR